MKAKNKFLASVLCLLMVAFCVISFSACGDDDCSHQWGNWTTTKEATCAVSGTQERKCSECGEVDTSTIEALNHDWTEATCSTPKTCKICSTTEGQVAAHAFTEETVKDEALKAKADCTNAAIYFKSCSCGEISTEETDIFTNGTALGHSDKNADHTCDNGCGKTDIGTHADANKDHVCDYGCKTAIGTCADSSEDNDHLCDYGCNARLENCSDAANDSDHSCDICGATGVTACSYDNATCGAPATCTECGSTTGSVLEHKDENYDHICDNGCGKNDMGAHADSTTDNDHLCDYGCEAALEECFDVDDDNDHDCDICGKNNISTHSYTENTALATVATCEDAATKTYECNCGDTYTENDGDKLGHNITGATATEEAVSGCEYVLVYTCQRKDCGDKVYGETVYNHKYIASISTPATCSAPGRKTYKCSVCADTSKAAEEIPADATGHNWNAGTVENGVRTDECSVCHTTKTVTVYSGTKTDEVNAGDLANKEIELNNANISLDSGVIDTIGNQNVTVSADKLEGDDRESLNLSDDQLAQVGNNPIYNFTINNGTENISVFGDDNWVTITLPYTLADGEDIDSIAIWFINDNGELESIKATYNNGYVTFKTNHFSYYTVTRLTPAERCALYGHGYACQHVEGSCTKDSYDLYVCVRCHDRYIDEGSLVVADGHDYSSETVNATCTENGYILYTCGDCGHSYRTKLAATGHDWDITDSADPTCEADGYTIYSCTNCNETYTIKFAKLAHAYTSTTVSPTCMSVGYTLYDCDNCEYSYTDLYVDALGHAYNATDWAWATDYSSATLTFVCGNDSEHTIVQNAVVQCTVVNGTCSNFVKSTYTASVSFNGKIYTDEKVIETGSADHNYSTEWTTSEDEHWRQCICGAKIDVSKHNFENETTTKAPSCTEAGESISSCVCGETSVTVIPATGKHSYVNGICDVCGKEQVDCDHTELHNESIDFGGLGACTWTLYYSTCDCGEVKYIDTERSYVRCDLDETGEDQYYDENGNLCMTATGSCSICGLSMSMRAVAYAEGCTKGQRAWYTFSVDDVVIIADAYYEYSGTNHYDKRDVIDLSKYGACGGSIIVDKCVNCGEITDIDDLDADCNIDFDLEPEAEQITDENGIIHYVQKLECPDCGLIAIVDSWTEEISVCETKQHMQMSLSCKETTIAELYDYYYNEMHEYEYSYEFDGVSCEDGVTIYYSCRICGDSYSYSTTSHSGSETVDIDLSEYGACGGTVTADCCTVCGYAVYVLDMDISCRPSDEIEEDILDENGVVIGTQCTGVCSNCGLVFVEKEWIEFISDCEQIRYEGAYIYSDGECIFSYVDYEYYNDHEYEYQYELSGTDCNSGYKVICTCTICGTTDWWWTSGHRTEYFEINLDEYDGCGGKISGGNCAICGEIQYINNMEVDCNFEESVTDDEIVDENGVAHYISTRICTSCGLKFVTDTWEIEQSSCTTVRYTLSQIYKDDELTFDYTITNTDENHDYEYDYEFNGEDCTDGYTVTAYCNTCGHTYTSHGWGHNTQSTQVYLSEFGFCYGYIYEHSCLYCDYHYISGTYGNCYWNLVEVNDEGYEVYECSYCGGTKLIYTYATEKDENCSYTRFTSVIFVMNGEEVYSYETTKKYTDHTYNYEFDMNGNSCTDGYTVITTCSDCNFSDRSTYEHHNSLLLFKSTPGCHSVEIYGCPCGYYHYIMTDSMLYDEELGMYICEECNSTAEYSTSTVEEDCKLIETTTTIVTISGEVVYSHEVEFYYDNHSFSTVRIDTVDGTLSRIVSSCDNCGVESIMETHTAVLEDHDGAYYFDYTLTPDTSASYTILGLADEDTYVTLYKLVAGRLMEVDYNDDSGNNGQFRLTAYLTAGTTYVYRIRFYDRSANGTIPFAFTQEAGNPSDCKHLYDENFSLLLDGSQSCEDGAIYGDVCCQCGRLSANVSYEHRTSLKERIDLTEYGACSGAFYIYSCACGQLYDTNLEYDSCDYIWTSNEYYDDEGRLVHVEVKKCWYCDIRYTRSYYTIKDREACTLTYYYTVVVNIGGVLVTEVQYTDTETDHDYTITAELMGGEGSTCSDGVIITRICKDCGVEYSSTSYYHGTFVKETIDLSELGSVCGGYATLYGCACGYSTYLNQDHSLCDYGSEWCELWIKDAVTNPQYTIDGYNSFSYSAYIYTCAVTDPEACAFKIRYARYWLRDASSCTAYRYETWQFGYNEETGDFAYEITYKTGSTSICHNYVNNSITNSQKYDCVDCGSYYYENYYYDENDSSVIKYEKFVSNTLNNGKNKYYEYIEESATNASGNRYTCRIYDKRIDSNGDVYWSEELRNEQPYTGTFGDNGYKVISSYSNSQNESYSREQAYVYYKGYSFEIYEHYIQGDYWYRYEYTYTFDNGCVQKSVYTNSEGENRENFTNVCKMWNSITIKKPTCTQDGERCYKCSVCEAQSDTYTLYALDHEWVYIADSKYYCFRCGLENINGASGSIIMEDLTVQYGNGEYYVIGYYAQNNVEFSQYVSLILADGTEIPILSGIDFIAIDGIRSFAFSKADVEEWAIENGYTDYLVRFSFVPVGSDGSFDYGITFAESTVPDAIVGDVSFKEYIGEGERKSYIITPTEDSVWTFTSMSDHDTKAYLCNANGEELAWNDDGGYNNNFKIVYELKAGETYELFVSWYSSSTSGYMPLLFIPDYGYVPDVAYPA